MFVQFAVSVVAVKGGKMSTWWLARVSPQPWRSARRADRTNFDGDRFALFQTISA